jgi:integrase
MARGSILARKGRAGTVTFYVKYRLADGTQVKKAVGSSRRDAERALTRALAAIDRGELRAGGGETFAAYATRWLEDHRPRVEPGTHRDYEKSIEKYLIPALGARKLSAVTPGHLRRLVADLASSGRLAPKTINNAIVPLRLMLAHAVEDGLIPSNPAATTAGAKQRLRLPDRHREMGYLRREEIPRYLAACVPAYLPLAELLLASGLRIGEALGLEWSDVDLAAGAILVRRSLKDKGLVGSTKSHRARRVEVGPRVCGILADHRARAGEHREAEGSLVFPAVGGGYLDRTYVSSGWHPRALRAAGLRRSIRLHDLRHSAAAAWLAAGLPLVYVQRQLGHADIATTVKHYGHLERGYLQDAAVRAEEAIWSPVPAR